MPTTTRCSAGPGCTVAPAPTRWRSGTGDGPTPAAGGWSTAASRALTEAALALPAITRVEIHCDEANTASAAVPRRLGYELDRIAAKPISAPGEHGREMIWVHRPG